MTAFCEIFGVNKFRMSSYDTASNGRSESFNSFINIYLRTVVDSSQKN